MRNTCALILCAGLILFSTGCESNKTRVAEGSVIGGVLGAAAGAGIGSLGGNAGAGAGIGAAVGALGGGIIGAQIDKKPGEQAQGTNPNQMTLEQVVNLVKQGTSEETIIREINVSKSIFTLSAAQVDNLKQQGVSQKVIDAMLQPK
ncbi:MAG: glycine zipper domain-containing protein [Candidatus Omnitrophica bacterium]|nr:glycine zipper domain-containing protein [Candidatus Omnitrophota bacterium]